MPILDNDERNKEMYSGHEAQGAMRQWKFSIFNMKIGKVLTGKMALKKKSEIRVIPM